MTSQWHDAGQLGGTESGWRSAAWIGSLGAVLCILLAYFLAGPIWQIHDDAYYAMLADGYGMVDRPVAAVPYMHPLVGHFLAGLRHLGLSPSYAIFLTALVLIAGAVLGYRFAEIRVGLLIWVLAAAAFLPVVLSLQYTAVCGILVAVAALILYRPQGPAPSTGTWALAGLLLWLATLLRVEMVVMAVLCLSPPLLTAARRAGPSFRSWTIGFILTASAVTVGNFVAGAATADNRLQEFYRLNDPMAVLMNYGYIDALRKFRTPLPAGISQNDLALMSRWFFADIGMMEPMRVRELTASVPTEELLRVRSLRLLRHLKQSPQTFWFWLTSATCLLAIVGRRRAGIPAGIAGFVMLSVAAAFFLKPFPERVAVGMALGLFLLALVNSRQCGHERRREWAWAPGLLALLLVVPISVLSVRDRLQLGSAARGWQRDKAALAGETQVYSFAGVLPLRAILPPFATGHGLPRTVWLGTMYFTPEVLDAERATGCGGFLPCLGSGTRTVVVASDGDIRLLSTLVSERFSKQLVIERTIGTPTFKAFVLSAR